MNSAATEITIASRDPLVRKAAAYRIQYAVRMVRALTLPKTKLILRVLRESDRELYVNEVMIRAYRILSAHSPGRDFITQPEVSTALTQLYRMGIVSVTRRSKYHYYSLNTDRILQINRALAAFLRPATEDTILQKCENVL